MPAVLTMLIFAQIIQKIFHEHSLESLFISHNLALHFPLLRFQESIIGVDESGVG